MKMRFTWLLAAITAGVMLTGCSELPPDAAIPHNTEEIVLAADALPQALIPTQTAETEPEASIYETQTPSETEPEMDAQTEATETETNETETEPTFAVLAEATPQKAVQSTAKGTPPAASGVKVIKPAQVSHLWQKTIVASTCTAKGCTKRVCWLCGQVQILKETEPTGHKYIDSVTEANCDTGGYTEHTCQNCGDSFRDSETSVLGHDWSDWEITQEPTEAATGRKSRSCARCQKEEVLAIPKLEHIHSYASEIATAPSCNQIGVRTFTCECGHKYTEALPKIEHSWGEWTVLREACETREGLRSRSCQGCGETQEETLPTVHTHSWSTKEFPPTCTEDGYILKTCCCGAKETVPSTYKATGHTMHLDTRTAADCVHAGTAHYYCLSCGMTKDESYYGDHRWVCHHEDAVTEKKPKIVCHCGWFCYAGPEDDYVSAFAAHMDSLPIEERYDHSYYGDADVVVVTPSRDWYECSVCGETQ